MGRRGTSSARSRRSRYVIVSAEPIDFTTISKSIPDARIKAALALIPGDLSGAKASAIASRVGLSRWRFEHLFKAQTGHTFRNAVRAIRLDTARRLLADPRLRIKEVAAKCGYATTASFIREFKRQFGKTPTSYRRSTLG